MVLKGILTAAVTVLLVAGCSKNDDTQHDLAASPVINPLTSPTCSTIPISGNGGIGGCTDKTMTIKLPAAPDTFNASYKKWNSTEWSPYRPGFYADVTFTISGSTLTITTLDCSTQYDWVYVGTYNECH